MKLKHIIRFLQLLHVGEVKVSEDNEWARCSCPLATYKHFKGTDENPSFGIKVNNFGESGYKCFTCSSGSLRKLIHTLNFTCGIPKAAADYYSNHEIFYSDRDNDPLARAYYRDVYEGEMLEEEKIPVPQEVLDCYPLLETSPHKYERDRVIDYFLNRGISSDSLFKYKVRHDPTLRQIIFPIYDTDGKVYRLKVRLRQEKTFYYLTPATTGFPDLPSWGRKDYIFGIQFYDPKQPVILVESETDVLRLDSLGVNNVLATSGPFNKFKARRINSSVVYLGFDSDDAGDQYAVKAIELLSSDHILYLLRWDAVEVRYETPKKKMEKFKPAKDAGDLQTFGAWKEVFDRRVLIDEVQTKDVGYEDVWATTKS